MRIRVVGTGSGCRRTTQGGRIKYLLLRVMIQPPDPAKNHLLLAPTTYWENLRFLTAYNNSSRDTNSNRYNNNTNSSNSSSSSNNIINRCSSSRFKFKDWANFRVCNWANLQVYNKFLPMVCSRDPLLDSWVQD